ncbi:MAG: hypothetical protein RBT49_03745 [Bacteroidales bacterium]|jgi:dTDP-4-amino-4,6-dideoxygalactose transaminase|nr:hypothetical protein [Bacteroidales bacterium]
MDNIIGGEIDISLDSFNSNENYSFYDRLLFYDSGRTALSVVLSNNYISNNKFLLPIYSCESIIKPFKELNIHFDYYDINLNFDLDLEIIQTRIHQEEFTAILIIDYFGFTFDKNVISKLKNFGLLVIEDISHLSVIPLLFNKYKSLSDIVFGSLRKNLPVADGGFIVKNSNFSFQQIEPEYTLHSMFKLSSKILRGIYSESNIRNDDFEETYLKLSAKAEHLLDLSDSNLKGMSNWSLNLLKRLDLLKIYEKRRLNFKMLLILFIDNELIDIPLINKDIDSHPEYMPYLFPILVNKKNKLIRETLKSNSIYTSIIWESFDKKRIENYPNSKYISENILCLPVDDRYGSSDMMFLFKKIRSLL